MEGNELQVIVMVFRGITERKIEEQKLQNSLTKIKQLKNRLQAENRYLQEQVNLNHKFEDILGQSQLRRLTRKFDRK